MNYDPQNIEDGVYTDMSIEVYHENNTHLSSSSIKEAFKSLAHFKAYLEKPNERKPHFDFGNAFELSVVDYEEFKKHCAVFDPEKRPEPNKNFGSTANKEWKASFYDLNKDKLIIPLTGDNSLDTLTLCKASLFKHQAAKALLTDAEYQTTIFWTCPHTGLKLKTRPDFWKPENSKRTAIVNDLKTDKDSESTKHLRTIYNLNYPIQAVMQIEGLEQAKLCKKPRFFWTVCSKSSPYNTEVYEFDSEDIKDFRAALIDKFRQIKQAQDEGVFLSYERERDYGIKMVEFPLWYRKQLGIFESIDK